MTRLFKERSLKKKTILLLAGSSLLLLTVTVIRLVSLTDEASAPRHADNKEATYTLANVAFASEVYTAAQPLRVSLDLFVEGADPGSVWLGFSVLSPAGEVVDFPATHVSFDDTQHRSVSLSPSMKETDNDVWTSGDYSAVFALWDSDPRKSGAVRLTTEKIPKAFRLYTTVDPFESFDKTRWFSRNGSLGRSRLRREHVSVNDGMLSISMPADTLDGGEIQTIALMHYGSYEVSMKLPDAPSSLTGFFLYKAPDYQSEIDIEVFNQSESEALFTSYANGAVRHEERTPLSFDPTSDFHRYRIDHYPDRVSFYIDDVHMQTWENGFTHEPMHLVVNTWFPAWLAGIEPEEDQALNIEWIRY